MEEQGQQRKRPPRKLLLGLAALVYGAAMATTFAVIPPEVRALDAVSEELPTEVAIGVKAAVFLHDYWWFISAGFAALGLLVFVGMFDKWVKTMIVMHVLMLIAVAGAGYLARKAPEMAGERLKDRAVEEVQKKLLEKK